MNKVVHFEIPFDKSERAEKFYKDVFKWKISKVPDMPYWMAHTVEVDDKFMPKESGAINGGLLQRDKEQDPSGMHPVIVIDVPEIDSACKKVESGGGKVVMPVRKVGDMGMYARCEDTEGNVIGLWQSLKKE